MAVWHGAGVCTATVSSSPQLASFHPLPSDLGVGSALNRTWWTQRGRGALQMGPGYECSYAVWSLFLPLQIVRCWSMAPRVSFLYTVCFVSGLGEGSFVPYSCLDIVSRISQAMGFILLFYTEEHSEEALWSHENLFSCS